VLALWNLRRDLHGRTSQIRRYAKPWWTTGQSVP
jgi:hypothetical protein